MNSAISPPLIKRTLDLVDMINENNYDIIIYTFSMVIAEVKKKEDRFSDQYKHTLWILEKLIKHLVKEKPQKLPFFQIYVIKDLINLLTKLDIKEEEIEKIFTSVKISFSNFESFLDSDEYNPNNILNKRNSNYDT